MKYSNFIEWLGIIGIIIVLLILILIPVIDYHNKFDFECKLYEINFACQMSNNSTMVFELIVAGSFAIIISAYIFYRQENLKQKRIIFAINRIYNQLCDLEFQIQTVIRSNDRTNVMYERLTTGVERISMLSSIKRSKEDVKRTLESLQGTLRISFDVLDPQLATRIEYFTRNGIEYCEVDNGLDFNPAIKQFGILQTSRESILQALPHVKRMQIDIFNDFVNTRF